MTPTFKDCSGSSSQRFWFTNDGRLALMDMGLCLDPKDYHVENGQIMVLHECRGPQASQGLTRGAHADEGGNPADGPYMVRSVLSPDMCIDEYHGVAELRPCNGGQTNPWTLSNGATQVRRGDADHGHRCLAAQVNGGEGPHDGTRLQVTDCADGDSNQNFWWSDDGRLSLRDTGLCVDIPEAHGYPGAPLQLWTCGDAVPEQAWSLGQPEHTSETAQASTHAQDPEPGHGEGVNHADLCPQAIHPGCEDSHCLKWAGDKLVVDKCHNEAGWTFVGGTSEIKVGGKCLASKSNSISVLDCDGTPEQQWNVGDTQIKIGDNMCLEVCKSDDGGYQGAPLKIKPCDESNENQTWSANQIQESCANGPKRRRRIENTKGRRMVFA